MAQNPWGAHSLQRLSVPAEPLQLSPCLLPTHVHERASRAHAEGTQPAVGVVLHLLCYWSGSSRKMQRRRIERLGHQIVLLQIDKISVGILGVRLGVQEVSEILGLQIAYIKSRNRLALSTAGRGQ